MDQAKYQTMLKTADAFNGVLRRHFVKNGKVHAPTIVSAAARMAGTLLFRSFDIDVRRIRPGSVVLSAQADAGIAQLGRLLRATLTQLGDPLDDESIAAATGTTAEAQMDLLAMQALLDAPFAAIQAGSTLTMEEAARAAAIGTALIIHDCREAMPIERGIVIAMFGFVEGSKTVPWRDGGTKPWYKIW